MEELQQLQRAEKQLQKSEDQQSVPEDRPSVPEDRPSVLVCRPGGPMELFEEVGKDSEDAKKENQYQHTSSSAKSSDSSSSNTSDGKRKDVKTRKPAVSMAAISPEEKKQLTDKVVEQLLTNSKQSQACVLL
ncbi:hypothetical protein LSAT2_018030 [Lamellibrachia satsuma]|nr:hypothetical protein LSAT2_018030 [Lamellibrachia satsuma]